MGAAISALELLTSELNQSHYQAISAKVKSYTVKFSYFKTEPW